MEFLKDTSLPLYLSVLSLIVSLLTMLFQGMAAGYQARATRDAARATMVTHLLNLTREYEDLSRGIGLAETARDKKVSIIRLLNYLDSIALIIQKQLITRQIRSELETLLLDALAIGRATGSFGPIIAEARLLDGNAFAMLRAFEARHKTSIAKREAAIKNHRMTQSAEPAADDAPAPAASG